MSQETITPVGALLTLVELAESTSSNDKPKANVIEKQRWWIWEKLRHADLFRSNGGAGEVVSDRKAGTRLAAVDALQPSEDVIRAGWIWVAGTITTDEGKSVTYCLPVVSAPVKLSRQVLGRAVVRTGDPEIHPLLSHSAQPLDPSDLAPMPIPSVPTPNTATRIGQLLGHPIVRRLDWDTTPWSVRRDEGLSIIAGVGLYTSSSGSPFDRGSSLSQWTEQVIGDTAFANLYSTKRTRSAGDAANRWPQPTRPLNRSQLRVIDASAAEPIVSVSGPPGTGKTHTMVEVALAAIARGESVLLGANSPHAVEMLAEHFASGPGPAPITFGGRTAGDPDTEISERLNSTPDPKALRRAEDRRSETTQAVGKLGQSISVLLAAEELSWSLHSDPALRLSLESDFAGLADPQEYQERLRQIRRSNGLLGSLMRGRRTKRLALSIGLEQGSGISSIESLINSLRSYRLATSSAAGDGLTLEASFDRLAELERRASDATGQWLNRFADQKLGDSRSGRRALANVATAVRSSRSKRRSTLARLESSELTDASPLWLGAVRDIDDVLPPTPAMFDLLILDEASQIDQLAAAGALLRAKRCVICGDSRQLRHVSFVSDDDISRATTRNLGFASPTLDIRSNSVFDVASAAGTGFTLDEHFRSAPHLIDFSARRFYQNQLHVATTNPLNHEADHIDVTPVQGVRGPSKVNEPQIEQALAEIERSAADGAGSIGVVSPFRAQVDSLTEAVLSRYRAEEIEDMGLSIGTVHAFQGSEHDTVIIMLTIGPDESPRSWSFVNRPDLFNVMVTRARHRVIVLNSDPNPPGLAGEYLVHSDPLTTEPKSTPHTSSWPLVVSEALAEAGQECWPNYTVGQHRVDFALVSSASPDQPIALIVEPHQDGPEAHIERELFLRRMGWVVRDAFASRWASRVGELAAVVATQGALFEPDLKGGLV